MSWRPIVGFAGSAVLFALMGYGVHAFADTFSDPDGVPRLVPFRAHLEQAGVPVTTPVTLTFTLYDAPSAGVMLWGPEDHTVTPAGGEVNVMLGETVRFAPSVLEGGAAYVEVRIGTTVLGRQRLGSVPYALRSDNGVPPGTIVSFGGETVPPGWELCDGRAISGSDPAYVALYTAIGEVWGDGGDGSGTMFRLPDLRGQFLRGAHGAGVDPSGDRAVGTPQSDAFGSHTHSINDPGHRHTGFHTSPSGADEDSGRPGALFDTRYGNNWGTTTNRTGISIEAAGGPETRPLNRAVNYIIKL